MTGIIIRLGNLTTTVDRLMPPYQRRLGWREKSRLRRDRVGKSIKTVDERGDGCGGG